MEAADPRMETALRSRFTRLEGVWSFHIQIPKIIKMINYSINTSGCVYRCSIDVIGDKDIKKYRISPIASLKSSLDR